MKFKKIFEFLISFFKKEKIDYALIGAFALRAYGYTRATQDVDFIVRYNDQGKIITYLESLGYETIYCSIGYSNHVHPIEGLGRIDFVYVRGKTADIIFSNVRHLLLFKDIKISVVSPEHLIALKIFAIKNDPERSFKELADIKYLISLPDIDMEMVRKDFEKYGLMEKYYELIGQRKKE